jgi:hypothetical protein
MTLEKFNRLIETSWKDKSLYNDEGKVSQPILEVFQQNHSGLRTQFLHDLRTYLHENDFEKLNRMLSFLAVAPLQREDYAAFQETLFEAMDKLCSKSHEVDIAAVTDFIWTLLDHTLHHATLEDEAGFKSRLKAFKSELRVLEGRYPAKVSLLYQKIGNFGKLEI